MQDIIRVWVVQVDLDIEDVGDGDEDDPGGYVTYNKDDDDENGTADYDDTGTVNDEDNLVKIELDAPSSRPAGHRVRLEVPYGQTQIRVWEDENKGTRVLPTDAGNYYKEWGSQDSVPSELYVEGYCYVSGTCELSLHYYPNYIGAALTDDVVNFRVVGIRPYTYATTLLGDLAVTATPKRSPQ